MSMFRKTIVGGLAALTLGAGVAAGAAPAEAQWRGHRGGHGYHRGGGWGGPALAAGVIGGLAFGTIAAQAARPRHYYPAQQYPAYGDGYAPVYAPACFKQQQAAYDPWGNFAGYRVVRVCQ